jgi:hypothetical protein
MRRADIGRLVGRARPRWKTSISSDLAPSCATRSVRGGAPSNSGSSSSATLLFADAVLARAGASRPSATSEAVPASPDAVASGIASTEPVERLSREARRSRLSRATRARLVERPRCASAVGGGAAARRRARWSAPATSSPMRRHARTPSTSWSSSRASNERAATAPSSTAAPSDGSLASECSGCAADQLTAMRTTRAARLSGHAFAGWRGACGRGARAVVAAACALAAGVACTSTQRSGGGNARQRWRRKAAVASSQGGSGGGARQRWRRKAAVAAQGSGGGARQRWRRVKAAAMTASSVGAGMGSAHSSLLRAARLPRAA